MRQYYYCCCCYDNDDDDDDDDTNDLLWHRDEYIKFWGQKVKVQGHGGITYAETVTEQVEAYSTRRLVSSYT